MMLQSPLRQKDNRSSSDSKNLLPILQALNSSRINFSEEEEGLLKEMFRKRERDDRPGVAAAPIGNDDGESPKRPSKVSRTIDPNATTNAATLNLSPKGGDGSSGGSGSSLSASKKLNAPSPKAKSLIGGIIGGDSSSLGMNVNTGLRDDTLGTISQANSLLGGHALSSFGLPAGALPSSLGMSPNAAGNSQMNAFNGANASGAPAAGNAMQQQLSMTQNYGQLQQQHQQLLSSLPVYNPRMDQPSSRLDLNALQQQQQQQQQLAILLQSQNSLQSLAGLNPLLFQQQQQQQQPSLSGLSGIDPSLLLLHQQPQLLQQQQQQDLSLKVPSWLLNANLPRMMPPNVGSGTPQNLNSNSIDSAGIAALSSATSSSSRSKTTELKAENITPIPQLSRNYGRTISMAEASDSAVLSPFQCYAREQIEFFEALETDVTQGARGRNVPISLGQVGIRCKFCKDEGPMSRGRAAVYFPTKFELVYQTAVNMTSIHLCQHCTKIPKPVRDKLLELRDQRSTAGGGKRFWAKATQKLGIIETCQGLRFTE